MQIRKVIEPLFTDEDFADLFPRRGQPAWPPEQLAIVSVLQLVEACRTARRRLLNRSGSDGGCRSVKT
ncbi:hypothetical protein [Streptomyces flaveus]|uniref:Transposase InsH N-terminal domain-containing protein n=1 Tax=Streptomyces flaveus TaxID=66370 RepID=A0A917R5B1_9ACTN|nr:hypothetical protein [Streptomyces flaveus]GGK89126.1 hypothetical protein GCM10010094_57770 [Streptomyces flaveus]